MSRLRSIAPQLGRLAAPLERPRDREGHSRQAEPGREWYGLKAWQVLRLEVFERDGYQCQCGCGRLEGDTSKLVADHKRQHGGDADLFWDKDNLQTLYFRCHNSAKQRADRAMPI